MHRPLLALLLVTFVPAALPAQIPAQTSAQPLAKAAAQTSADRAFTGADLFRINTASDPRISPDGTMIAYVRLSPDIMADRTRPSLWLVDSKTGAQRPLVTGPGAYSAPRWSPDGTRIAYVASDGDGAPQLNILWLASGASARVTNLPQSPDSLAWSPDGKTIAYVMHVPGEAKKLGAAPAKPEGAKWAAPLQIIDRVVYRHDGGGYVEPGYSHIFLVPADGGSPRQLTFGAVDDGGPLSWAPDGSALYYSANRTSDWERDIQNSEVYRVDIATGALAQLTTRQGPDAAPTLSPDGRHIAYLGFDDRNRSYEVLQLFVMDVDGSNVRPLTPTLDRDIDSAIWLGNDRLIVSYDDHGQKKVAAIGLNGAVTPLVDGLVGGSGLDRPYTGGSFTVSKTGSIAYTGGDAQRPADLFVTNLSMAKKDGAARQLTHLNEGWMAAKDLATVAKLPVTAPDGRAIDAWLATPANRKPGVRVPLILEIHGGPNAAYGPAFSTDVQLYAAAGYAVLYVNPRGSTSYGDEFANLIDRAYPGADYDDLIAAVDAAIAQGTADPDNLFVTGGSGGGVLTAWIVGKTDRFKGAATQKPVINWISEALTMDMTPFTSRYWFDKKPWEDPMEYWRRSPLSLIGNVTTPTLVVVGEEDYRTPDSESEQYYAALQIQGVPTAFVKVPGASHGGFTSRPSQSAAKAAAIIAWFDTYRTPAPQP